MKYYAHTAESGLKLMNVDISNQWLEISPCFGKRSGLKPVARNLPPILP